MCMSVDHRYQAVRSALSDFTVNIFHKLIIILSGGGSMAEKPCLFFTKNMLPSTYPMFCAALKSPCWRSSRFLNTPERFTVRQPISLRYSDNRLTMEKRNIVCNDSRIFILVLLAILVKVFWMKFLRPVVILWKAEWTNLRNIFSFVFTIVDICIILLEWCEILTRWSSSWRLETHFSK